jgi:hypothetical protein
MMTVRIGMAAGTLFLPVGAGDRGCGCGARWDRRDQREDALHEYAATAGLIRPGTVTGRLILHMAAIEFFYGASSPSTKDRIRKAAFDDANSSH